MSSESRPRQRPIVNPEHLEAAARRIVNAWLRSTIHKDREDEINAAVADVARMLKMDRRDLAPVSKAP